MPYFPFLILLYVDLYPTDNDHTHNCPFPLVYCFMASQQPVEFLSDVYLMPLIPSPSNSEEDLNTLLFTQNKELDPDYYPDNDKELPFGELSEMPFEVHVEEIPQGRVNGHVPLITDDERPPDTPLRFSPSLSRSSPYAQFLPHTSIPPPPPPPPPRMALSSPVSFYPVLSSQRLFTIDEERTYI